MKKSYFRVAAMVAASVLSVSSFVSCDEEEENNSFKSETFTVELPRDSHIIGFGPSYSYRWVWTNRTEAAVDSISFSIESKSDSILYYGGDKEIWTFKTKEKGVRELRFNYLKYTSGITSDGMDTYDNCTVLKDTLIDFRYE
ncbi:MAG: protease inhibitor I42 family protein [Paludibacteraceae bacterium]|nr:protease inhibitor I42 family protein [Paludibacteraceae bacterium]